MSGQCPDCFYNLCRIKIENVIIVVKNTMYAYRANALARGEQFVVHENATTNL